MFLLATIIILSYLVGSIPTSIIISKLTSGIDIREHGSGNAGGSNVMRILGWKQGLLVIILDALKGAFAVVVIARLHYGGLPFQNISPFDDFTLVQIIAGIAAVIGHIWTVFAGFRGGKGIATALGMLIMIITVDMLVALGIFIIVVTISRYISLGSILAAVSIPFTLFFRENILHDHIPSYGTLLPFVAAVSLLVVFTHRKNVMRLLNGTESKLSFKKKEKMKIAVLGAGGWGTTLGILLHYNGHQVTLWEYQKKYVKELIKKRINSIYLPGVQIPEEILITHDLKESVNQKNLIVLAVPSQFLRSVIEGVDYSDIKNSILVSVAKGIENKRLMTMSQMLKDVHSNLSDNQIGVLSGPSHAEEVSRRIPTAVVAASTEIDISKSIQAAFINSYFRVYSSTDILGVELGGAFKNVIAIGAGIIDGAGFGDNTKAAIMTRGVAEISRLGLAMGARPETFAGLSGMGDLIVTCMSKHSRNRFVGEEIGKGKKLNEVLKSMDMVAEGVETSRSASKLAEKNNVETPITTEVYKILFEDKDPVKATTDLMTRDMKTERH